MMFHNIPKPVADRMHYLEQLDARDRADGTTRKKRLRQIPRETGRFLALLLASAPEGACLEIGTSAGYSSLWLALACREYKSSLVTFEHLEDKTKLARETIRQAKVDDVVELIYGDASEYINNYENISFCFLDAEKEDYQDFYDRVIPKMVSGGLFTADNLISHREDLKMFQDSVLNDHRVDSLVVPIGKGILLCRKV
jgi:predicted O-methyltransferase YrrM